MAKTKDKKPPVKCEQYIKAVDSDKCIVCGKDKKKHKERRPPISEARVKKLEEAFKAGFNVQEACIYAGISRTTYYNYAIEGSEFLDRMDSSRKFIFMKAKRVVAKAIIENESVQDSWKYLEKRDEEFQDKGFVINNQNTQADISEEQADRIADKMEQGLKARADYWKRKYEKIAKGGIKK